MITFRLILPQWAKDQNPNLPKVREGQFSEEQIKFFNEQGYNIYYLPNYPSIYHPGQTVDGKDIDVFKYVFVDCDLKDGEYADKESFIQAIAEGLEPTTIVDSGNGIHAYWSVSDLDAMTYLKLQRRLMRRFRTDEAVCTVYQLMRFPGTLNTKVHGNFKPCEALYESSKVYTAEDLDRALPQLTSEDEAYCKEHYEKTYNLNNEQIIIQDKLPLKFAHLIKDNQEVKDIWSGKTDDRSKADYRLGHIMFASGFSREEALSVLVNSAKALARAPKHRVNYATNIVDKIWQFEETEDKSSLGLSMSVAEILQKSAGKDLVGTRFRCWNYIDDTEVGFRLGHVIGLVGGSGIGKTAIGLNMFEGFVQNNPEYDHIIVSLEQPINEIAARWKKICGNNTERYSKVHVIGNYNPDGSFRDLSLNDIKNDILKFQQTTGRKVGAVVIDHIGVLNLKDANKKTIMLEDLCKEMKTFAVQTNTLLIMQSQAPRAKAGIGDLELDKDAAYGTVKFESFCDYLITLWQPLKRCYAEGAPTTMAFKFCKIRHKNQQIDKIQEDVPYIMYFDPKTERLRELTENEQKSVVFFNNKSVNKRKQSKTEDMLTYNSRKEAG